jgi:hypothetical protein
VLPGASNLCGLLQHAAETGRPMARTIAYHGNASDRWHWPDRKYAEAYLRGVPALSLMAT